MKKAAISLECDFGDLTDEELEGCCKYEYLRESKGFREGLANPKCEALPVVACADWMDNARLVFALKNAGYPVPWKKLGAESRANLTQVLSWNSKDQKRHPVLRVQEFAPGHDPVEQERLWRELAYYEAATDRNYFFGLFRLDETYNETEARKAFTAWFRERHAKTKGGGIPKWRARLKQLAVVRIWKLERNQWKRLKLVAEFCGYNGCRKEMKAYRERCRQGRGDKPMSSAAKVEMSDARKGALIFFKSLFPSENPLSY